MQCKLNKKCQSKSADLYNCWDPECDGWMHEGCCSLLLDRYSVKLEERPQKDDQVPDGEPIVFCKMACYRNWFKSKKKAAKAVAAAEKEAAKKETKKRKVPWEDDGSLELLMEWLTTEGNYGAYCGSNGNISGQSKTQYNKKIAEMIKETIPDWERDGKDVDNKIQSLERSFRIATDWANNTGQGVDNPGDFEAAILKKCPLYKELEPMMGDRPNATPLATNEDDEDSEKEKEKEDVLGLDDTDDDDDDDDISGLTGASKPVAGTPNSTAISATTTTETKSTTGSGDKATPESATAEKKSNKKRLHSTVKKGSKTTKRPKKESADDIISKYLGGDDDDKPSLVDLREREVASQEKVASARWMEATAVSNKANAEAGLLSIQQKAALLRERQLLKMEGVSQEDIDSELPLSGKTRNTTE